jgi:hypothetical protein
MMIWEREILNLARGFRYRLVAMAPIYKRGLVWLFVGLLLCKACLDMFRMDMEMLQPSLVIQDFPIETETLKKSRRNHVAVPVLKCAPLSSPSNETDPFYMTADTMIAPIQEIGHYSGMWWMTTSCFLAHVHPETFNTLEDASVHPFSSIGLPNVAMTRDWMDLSVSSTFQDLPSFFILAKTMSLKVYFAY